MLLSSISEAVSFLTISLAGHLTSPHPITKEPGDGREESETLETKEIKMTRSRNCLLPQACQENKDISPLACSSSLKWYLVSRNGMYFFSKLPQTAIVTLILSRLRDLTRNHLGLEVSAPQCCIRKTCALSMGPRIPPLGLLPPARTHSGYFKRRAILWRAFFSPLPGSFL